MGTYWGLDALEATTTSIMLAATVAEPMSSWRILRRTI
jgi:hypothetical protein